jgi:quercetin dioxygenase-like cupin family protein
MAEHFERDTPGMHTSDTLDYGIVIRGEVILELDDGKTVHLRQGDCVVQNGTRHRWRNPLSEPCLMAFVLIGGQREA